MTINLTDNVPAENYQSLYKFFERIVLCSPRLHLFDQKYSNIVKYYYNIK